MASKYSSEQLKAMATIVLEEENQMSNRPLHLYITVSQRTGIPPMEVRERIIQYARGPLHATA